MKQAFKRGRGDAGPATPKRLRREGGFTLVEIMIALCVIVLSLVGLVASIMFTARTNATIRENETAARAAQDMIEKMRTFTVDSIFARYNYNTADDPLGPPPSGVTITPTKVSFRIPEFDPAGGADPDGDSGVITFPGNGTLLAEGTDPNDPLLEDLDADGVKGEADVSGGYNLLPIIITIRWKGISGQRTLVFRQILMVPGFTYPTNP